MSVEVVVLWILVGWCGTPPKPWPGPWPPEKRVNRWMIRIAGVVGGFVGGWAFSQLWSIEGDWNAIYVAATAIGAWVGGTLISQLAIDTVPLPEKPAG